VRLRAALPNGRFQELPGGLRNVWGVVRGRDPSRVVVVGAHYDTKDIPGFVGAIDGASGTAVLLELARIVKPRTIGPNVVFVLFDGEESPAGTSDSDFLQEGLRGSKAFAPAFRDAQAMILLDFVGNKQLVLRRETLSDAGLWAKLRAAARRVGVGSVFPAATQGAILDDHYPFRQEGVPSIDLIDFDFPCWHRTCDDLSQVSKESLDETGEAVYELLRSL
jgi:Zn-dependent M28 family amino/carboxypeptidase